MWIFTSASLSASCWRSVLTATNSTATSPASIIRLTAFSPAPPTHDLDVREVRGVGARSAMQPRRRLGQRLQQPRDPAVRRRLARLHGLGRLGPGRGRRHPVRVLRRCLLGQARARPRAWAADARRFPRAARRERPFLPSRPASARLPVAQSSASGPHARLRFRAIEHLLRELPVRVGRGAGQVVLEHRASLQRLGVADRLLDAGLVDQVAEVLLQDLDRLARMQRPAVVHRREDPLDPDVGIEVLPDHRQRVLELDEAPSERYSHCTGTITPLEATSALIVSRPSDGGVSTTMKSYRSLIGFSAFSSASLAADHAREEQLAPARSIDDTARSTSGSRITWSIGTR